MTPLRRLNRGCSMNSSRIGTAKRRGIATRDCCAFNTVSQACMSSAISGAGPACRSLSSRSTAPHSNTANRNVGVTGLSASDARIGVGETQFEHFRMHRRTAASAKAAADMRKQMLEEPVLLQQLDRLDAESRQKQFQDFIEQPRRRHAVEQISEPPNRRLGSRARSRNRAWPRSAPRAACAPDPRDSASPDRRSTSSAAPGYRRRRRRNPKSRNHRCCSTGRSRRNPAARHPLRWCRKCCRAGCARVVSKARCSNLVDRARALLTASSVRILSRPRAPGAAAARKVATSMISWPKCTWARRNRRPIRRQLRNRRRTSSGNALVATSKSLGVMPSSKSRTAPPTRNA